MLINNNNNSIDIFPLIKQEMHSGKYFQHSQLYYSFLFFFSSSTSVVDLVQATLNNVSLILNIFCQLMVLPLAYQLTFITGNFLVNTSIVFFDYSTIAFIKQSRTLAGGRSERNDHLLLHAFTQRDYIVPECTMISNHRGALKHAQEVSRSRRERRLFQ